MGPIDILIATAITTLLAGLVIEILGFGIGIDPLTEPTPAPEKGLSRPPVPDKI